MTLLAFGLLVLVTHLMLTAAIGGVLDLPSLQAFRCTLAERKMRPLAVLVAAAPALTALLDLPGRLAAASPIKITFAVRISLICGALFSAAVAGCWLAMDEGGNPHPRPKPAIIISFVVLVLDVLLIPTIRNWWN